MPIAPHIVVVHGLGRTRFDMRLLAHRLNKRFPGSKVHAFGYASRKLTLAESTEQLANFVNRITESEPVSFVGHSLGGIVVRSLDLSGMNKAPLHRLVTLGSPHGGARIAQILAQYRISRAIFGPILNELAVLNLSPSPQTLEIGCVVGATGSRFGFLPIFGCDNDGLVLTSEAKFSGCTDHITRFSFHGTMPFSSALAELAGRFLESGRF